MNIREATASYEKWAAHHTKLVPADLGLKHRFMRQAPFEFFRATFYRWMQLWPEVCPDLKKRPARWLHHASKEMSEATRRDWKQYCSA